MRLEIMRSLPTLRMATPEDADAICGIYNHYVTTTVVSFEEAPVPTAAMAARIAELPPTHAWLVAEDAGALVGYAYGAPWRARPAYRHAVESTIYVARDRAGQGIGSTLYAGLIAELRRRAFHCIIGGIALPNPASIALHEKLGFTKVAHFREVGWKFGRRIDVGYWQFML